MEHGDFISAIIFFSIFIMLGIAWVVAVGKRNS